MADIVQQSSVSYDSLKSDLTSYVQSLDDYSLRWKDLYEGGPGQTLIELIASMGAYLNLVALKSRREAYIDEAKLTSSIYNIATTLGYSINRATSPSYSISITCLNTITQTKEVPIANYNSQPVSLLQDTTFIPGINSAIVVLGTWKTFTASSSTSVPYTRFLIEDSIDNNLYHLYINGQEIPVVKASELLDSTNVLMRTYFSGTFLIFGDGIFGLQLNIGDQLEFDYVTPGSVSQDASLNVASLASNVGTINSGQVVSYGTDPDSNQKLAAVATGYYTTKRRLITYSDYRYIALSYNGIISVNVQKHPGICCTMDVCVIGDTGRTLSSDENQALLAYMDDYQVIGTTINLVAPVSTNVSVSMIIVIQQTADQSAITEIIQNYLSGMTLQLGQFFSISGCLNLYLPGVIGIYPQYPIVDRQAAYNEFFILENLQIQYTTIVNGIKSFGADATLGYS